MASSGTVRIETEGERKRDDILREEDREDTRFYRKKGESCRS